MSQLNKLYRNFIILQEDERGYESSNDKTLSGYSKIEARGDVCKVSFYAQNLRNDDDYCMMIICSKKDVKKILNLGKITVSDGGKAEVTKEYSIDDIAGLGVSYDKISGAAIGKMKNDIPVIIMCGFINSEEPSDNWKNYKVVKSINEKLKDKMDYIKKEDKKKKDDKKDDKKLDKKDDKKWDKKDDKKWDKKDDKKNKCDEHREEDIQNEDIQNEDIQNEDVQNEENILENRREESSNQYMEDVIGNVEEIIEEVIMEKGIDNPFANKQNKGNPFAKEFDEPNASINRNTKKNKFDEYEEGIEKKSDTFTIRGSVGEYFEGIANGFEHCRNKYDEIKYCKWYKVPVSDLNQLCNMSNYNRYTVAYYPMLNYYPYIRKNGHFMLGYKCDEDGNLKYIVYGIPGRKNIDEQPYEGKTGFVTWVNNETRDGSGCWLMFYDFKNSTVVVPMK